MNYIFISSTFSDMQIERDLFRNKIIPRINEKIDGLCENFDAIDLRWGIDTTHLDDQSVRKKVIEICLDRIFQCNPFFVVFLGNRAGWILSEEEYNNSINLENYRKKLSPQFEVEKDKSITEIEILYELFLSRHYNGHCLFYVRNLETNDDNFFENEASKIDRINLLRKKAIEEYGAKEYNGRFVDDQMVIDDDLVEMISNDILNIIVKENNIINKTDFYDLKKESEFCFGRNEEISKIKSFVLSDKYKKMLVFGDSGVGKSTVISKALIELTDYLILPFYVKKTNFTTLESYLERINDVLYSYYNDLEIINYNRKTNKDGIIKCLKNRRNINTRLDIDISLFNYLLSMLSRFSKNKIILYLDGIDELDYTPLITNFDFLYLNDLSVNNEVYDDDELWFDEYLADKVKIIISSSNKLSFNESKLSILNFLQLTINPISKDYLLDSINGLFTSIYKKDKPVDMLLKSIYDKTLNKSSLYLSVAMHHLLYLGKKDFEMIATREKQDFEYRQRFLLEVVENIAMDEEHAIVDLFSTILENTTMKIDSLVYLSLCDDGLTRKELKALDDSYNELDFQYLNYILRNYFIVDYRNRIKFSHKICKNALANLATKKHRLDLSKFWKKNGYIFNKSFLRNEIILIGDARKIINNKEYYKNETFINSLQSLIEEGIIIEKNLLSISNFHKLLSNGLEISKRVYEHIIISECKYFTNITALSYLRNYYPLNEGVSNIIMNKALKEDNKITHKIILYLNPLTSFKYSNYFNDNYLDTFCKIVKLIRTQYCELICLKTNDINSVYKIREYISSNKHLLNNMDYLFVMQEYSFLLINALYYLSNEHFKPQLIELCHETKNRAFMSFNERFLISSFLFVSREIHYLELLNKYECEYFVNLYNGISKIILKSKNLFYKQFVDGFSILCNHNQDYEKLEISDLNYKSNLIAYSLYYNSSKMILENVMQFIKKNFDKIDPVNLVFLKIRISYFLNQNEKVTIYQELEKELKKLCYFSSGRLSLIEEIYKNEIEAKGELNREIHKKFLVELANQVLIAVKCNDYYSLNEKKLYGIFKNFEQYQNDINSDDFNSMYSILEKDPFVQVYIKDNPKYLVRNKFESIDEAFRFANVAKYYAEECYDDGYKYYILAIKYASKCLKISEYNSNYSFVYERALIKMNEDYKNQIEHRPNLMNKLLYITLSRDKIWVFRDSYYEKIVTSQSIYNYIFKNFKSMFFLCNPKTFIELIDDFFDAKDIIFSELDPTLSLFNLQKEINDNEYFYEFLVIVKQYVTNSPNYLFNLKKFIKKYKKVKPDLVRGNMKYVGHNNKLIFLREVCDALLDYVLNNNIINDKEHWIRRFDFLKNYFIK